MEIYHYHPETGEYLGKGSADADPLVDDNWLIPAHATPIAPPEVGAGKVAVFDVGLSAWTVITSPPAAVEELPPEQKKDPNILRAAAYADPFTGSDRYFIEAARKRASGDLDGALEAEQIGLARVTEIQSAYPIESLGE